MQTGDVARSKGQIKTYTALYNDIGLAQSKMWNKGTLCITIAANIADTGILDFDACFPDSVVGFQPIFYDVQYFDYFIKTYKNRLMELAPSTAQKNINLNILNNILVPIPPLSEEKRILIKVKDLMKICDELEKNIEHSKKDSELLMKAVLQEGFV